MTIARLTQAERIAANERGEALYRRAKKCRLKLLWIAQKISVPFPTMYSWLSGYNPLPQDFGNEIERIISEEERQLAATAS